MNLDRISLVGLGKLGLCLAAIYADKGIDVLGVDINKNVVDKVNAGESPIIETGLAELIKKNGGKSLKATLDIDRAITETDATIILTATPSLPDGGFSNCQIEAALTSLAKKLATSDKPYQLFVISSTVVPGSIENSFIPLIEKLSGRKLNEGFGICYDPDFVALGNVVKDFQNPDMVIIGESDHKAGETLEILHSKILENSAPVCRMSLASGEIAKVCLNAFITTKISFANLIGNICSKFPGANPDNITDALGHDKRISPYYFKAGLSYGGTCFPRDTWALSYVLKSKSLKTTMMDACEEINKSRDAGLLDAALIAANDAGAKRVGILGLAFKPGTPVIVESPGIKLVQGLIDKGLKVVAYDPLALPSAREVLGDKIDYAASARECLDSSDVCVLTLPSKNMAQDIYDYESSRSVAIIDAWRILNKSLLPTNIEIKYM